MTRPGDDHRTQKHQFDLFGMNVVCSGGRSSSNLGQAVDIYCSWPYNIGFD